jgi:PBP1b-binding outer membrane lipoprotein LpoB
MKIQTTAILIVLIISIILSGCSSQSESNIPNSDRGQQPPDFQRGQGFNRTMNMTDEEREMRFAEMQKIAADACLNKEEGASCQITGSMRNSSGTCKNQEDKLICIMERPIRQDMPEQPR